jgi:hypothetical protein
MLFYVLIATLPTMDAVYGILTYSRDVSYRLEGHKKGDLIGPVTKFGTQNPKRESLKTPEVASGT